MVAEVQRPCGSAPLSLQYTRHAFDTVAPDSNMSITPLMAQCGVQRVRCRLGGGRGSVRPGDSAVSEWQYIYNDAVIENEGLARSSVRYMQFDTKTTHELDHPNPYAAAV